MEAILLRETILSHANLSNARMWYASLDNIHGFDTNLSGADLMQATLFGVYLYRLSAAGAILTDITQY